MIYFNLLVHLTTLKDIHIPLILCRDRHKCCLYMYVVCEEETWFYVPSFLSQGASVHPRIAVEFEPATK